MITSVELPGPALLWTRWAALAAALNAIGYDDVWTVGERGGHHDDGGGNWSHLTLIEGGRAVLFGYDDEYSATLVAEPPLDLLAGAPAWLPWDDLVTGGENDELGYVLWYDDGRWSRVDYPDGLEDGLGSTAESVLDDEAALAELDEFVFEWGQHDVDTPAEHAAVERPRACPARLGGDAGVERAFRARTPVVAGAGCARALDARPGPGHGRPLFVALLRRRQQPQCAEG